MQIPTGRIALFILLVWLTSCRPEGLINKVKYNGEVVINTCESLSADVLALAEKNTQPDVLHVSAYDNSDFTYFYLEPGQVEVKNDTLFFRLEKDLDYLKYLDRGVTLQVHLTYQAPEKIQDLAEDPSGKLGVLSIDRDYYIKNRRPVFMYKFPLNGKNLAGKQLYVAFSVAEYKSTGDLKRYFCQTDATPLGRIIPACCVADRWERTRLQSVVDFPPLEIKEEAFAYAGFTATLDVTFQEGVYDYPDSLLSLAIQSYIEKFKRINYTVTRVALTGYASPVGSEKRNKTLSENRAKAVYQGLKTFNASNNELEVTFEGRGEDWVRVEELVQRSQVLEGTQKDEVLAILNQEISLDAKEGRMRQLSYWKLLEEEVMARCRHTEARLDFSYAGPLTSLDRYEELLPLSSRKLEQVAKTEIKVGPYRPGVDLEATLASLNDVLRQKASANLYVMRASYSLAKKDYPQVIEDLRQAEKLDPNNPVYEKAIQGYKVMFADDYSLEEKKKLLEEYTQLVNQNPGDRKLFFNRAILMDKIGYVSGALREYDNLLEAEKPSVANLNNRGVARLKANMFTAAESDFQQALSRDNRLAEAYYNLAAIYAYRGLTSRTIQYLDQAIAIAPQYKQRIFNNPVFSMVSEDPKFDKYRGE